MKVPAEIANQDVLLSKIGSEISITCKNVDEVYNWLEWLIANSKWTHEWDTDLSLLEAKIYDANGEEIGQLAKCNVETGLARVYCDDGICRDKEFAPPLKVVMSRGCPTERF